MVTLPETTPVLEATELTRDLARADIHPWAWVVNNALSAAHPTSPLLARRAAAESPQLDAVRGLAPRLVVVPTQAEDPGGPERLERLPLPTVSSAR